MVLHRMKIRMLNGRRFLHICRKLGAGVRMNNIEEAILPYEKLEKNVDIVRQRLIYFV